MMNIEPTTRSAVVHGSLPNLHAGHSPAEIAPTQANLPKVDRGLPLCPYSKATCLVLPLLQPCEIEQSKRPRRGYGSHRCPVQAAPAAVAAALRMGRSPSQRSDALRTSHDRRIE